MISLLKHEPSAQSPWQNTTLGFPCVDFAFIFVLLSLMPAVDSEDSRTADTNRDHSCSEELSICAAPSSRGGTVPWRPKPKRQSLRPFLSSNGPVVRAVPEDAECSYEGL